jgi:hypothetical protein
MAISAGVGPAEALADGNTTMEVVLAGTTAGRTIVVGCIWGSNTITWDSVDIGGQAGTIHAGSLATNASLLGRNQFATLSSLSSGGDKTITATFSGTLGSSSSLIVAWEFDGCLTSGAFDAANAATAFGTPSLSLTTVAANCHIIALVQHGGGGAPTAGTGYTLDDLTDADWFNASEQDTDFDAGVAGAKTVNFTGVSEQYALSAISLKPATGGGGGRTTRNTRAWPLGMEVGMNWRG